MAVEVEGENSDTWKENIHVTISGENMLNPRLKTNQQQVRIKHDKYQRFKEIDTHELHIDTMNANHSLFYLYNGVVSFQENVKDP